MKSASVITALIGLAVVAALVAMNDFAEIGRAILAAGFGIFLVIALHVPQIVASGLAWRFVVPPANVPSVPSILGLRLIREAVNALLPVAQVGGEFVNAKLLAGRGVPLGAAAASVIVDKTLEMFSQVIFTLLGVGLLVVSLQNPEIARWLVRGAAIALVVLAAFVTAQRFGLLSLLERGLLRLAQAQQWAGLEGIAGLHQAIVSLYRSPQRLCLGAACHLTSWLLGGVEVMAALVVLGHPIGWRDALIIESVGQAFRSLGFAVPGALAVQEGGLILVCGLLGIGPDGAIELSLLKRARELALGIPGLLAWRWLENHRAADKVPSLSPLRMSAE
jgi:putative membrane protein